MPGRAESPAPTTARCRKLADEENERVAKLPQKAASKELAASARRSRRCVDCLHHVVVPITMMCGCSGLCNVLSYVATRPQLLCCRLEMFNVFRSPNGLTSLTALLSVGQLRGWLISLLQMAMAPGLGSQEAWTFLFILNFVALLLYWLPGPEKSGLVSMNGVHPQYVDNGVTHCIVFTAMFIFGSNGLGDLYSLGWYDLGVIYQILPELIGALNLLGISLCVLLYFKGLYSTTGPDSGRTGGGFVFDIYRGTELYPKICGVDVKRFVKCRVAMTLWMLASISCAYRSWIIHREIDPAIVLCALSQYVYVAKFYLWEIGYLRSMDVVLERTGFNATWGCLVWIPSIHTLHTCFLVNTPSRLSWRSAGTIFTMGLIGVLLNWTTDAQRTAFRESNGEKLVWGEKPRVIRAKYKFVNPDTGVEETRTSLLLASGLWAYVRHPQYLFELMAAWSWSILGAGGWHLPNGVLPLFYAAYLTVHLLLRIKRDEERCIRKYGDDYLAYSKVARSKIIPFVY